MVILDQKTQLLLPTYSNLKKYIADNDWVKDQIYNANETTLYFGML